MSNISPYVLQKSFRQNKLDLFDETDGLIDHIEIAESKVENSQGRKFAKDNSGKFYTPEEIGIPLVEDVLKSTKLNSVIKTVSIIDPFCGDGRLLEWLIQRISNSNIEIKVNFLGL